MSALNPSPFEQPLEMKVLKKRITNLENMLEKALRRIDEQHDEITELEIKINYIATETEAKVMRMERVFEAECNRLEGEINNVACNYSM
jgi:ferritin-like metal-binding protein YciE